ncbi:plasmid replication protein, partial [Vibrio parahaemolyticus]
MGKLSVVHANELVEASYALSIDELRVIALASTKVDSRNSNVGEVRIDVSEFKKAYGLNHGRVYSDLREAVKSIMRKPIRLFDGKEVLELAWLSSNRYRIDDGSYVTIKFSNEVEPYLFELKDRFTAINFEYAARLNTPFSFRLYQWLYKAKKLNKNKKGDVVEVHFEVDWMKSQAALIGEYERWGDFNDRVLKPAIEKINANTDLSIIY